MIISIGILAWNEEEVIESTLRSLFEQSLIRELHAVTGRLEVVVVPNGCSDKTEQFASRALAAGAASLPTDRFVWHVHALSEPGKANAWNHFIHRFSDPAADYIFLMDADISFTHPDTLKNMLLALERNIHAEIATDIPQKHVLFKTHKTIFDRISLAIGRMTQAAPAQLTGQLYCSRSHALRRIHMPPGLMTEDGYIKFMVCTGMLRHPVDSQRIIRAPDASHVFESYTRIKDIFFNQRRQQIAHSIYVFLREYLSSRVGERDAGEIVRDNNMLDPDWYRKLIRQRVAEGDWWVIYPGALTARFKRLANLSPARAFLGLPVALIGFLMDAVVLIAANRKLKSGSLVGIWKDTKTTRLDGVTPGPDSGALPR